MKSSNIPNWTKKLVGIWFKHRHDSTWSHACAQMMVRNAQTLKYARIRKEDSK